MQDKIIGDLTSIIKLTLSEAPKVADSKKIEREIAALRSKKVRIIDLAAEGAISAADMKEQNDYYTEQIQALERKAVEADRINMERKSQTKRIEDYIQVIKKLSDVDLDDEGNLHTLLDRATVYNNNTVDLYLTCLPFGVRLHYKASGKMDFFNVEVESYEQIAEDSNSDVQ